MGSVPSSKMIVSAAIVEDGAIWEKQPDETVKAFSAFTYYMKLEPNKRSIVKAVKECYGPVIKDSTVRVWERWSSQYQWVARASAFDQEKEREACEAQIKAIKALNEKTVKIAQGLQQKALARLVALQEAELSPELVLRYLQIGTTLERLALGQPTEISESRNMNANMNIDFTTMTKEELREALGRRLRHE